MTAEAREILLVTLILPWDAAMATNDLCLPVRQLLEERRARVAILRAETAMANSSTMLITA